MPGAFAVCRLDPSEAVPGWVAGSRLASITRTPEELSLVCAEERVPEDVRCERGWRCLVVQGPLPLTMTGVLESLARPLAEAGVSIFALSTFDTDHLLVQAAQLAKAVAALRAAGHAVGTAADHPGRPGGG